MTPRAASDANGKLAGSFAEERDIFKANFCEVFNAKAISFAQLVDTHCLEACLPSACQIDINDCKANIRSISQLNADYRSNRKKMRAGMI